MVKNIMFIGAELPAEEDKPFEIKDNYTETSLKTQEKLLPRKERGV